VLAAAGRPRAHERGSEAGVAIRAAAEPPERVQCAKALRFDSFIVARWSGSSTPVALSVLVSCR
jgi:hypothetical protein